MNVIKPRKAPREPEASLIAVKKKPGPSTGGGSGSGNNSSSAANNNNNTSSSGNSSPKAPNLKKNRDDAIRHDFCARFFRALLLPG